VQDAIGAVELAFDPDAAVAALSEKAAYTAGRPLAARMPFSYRRMPAPVRNVIRNAMTRRRAAEVDSGWPSWPCEPSVEALRAVYLAARRALEPGLEPLPFWPDGRQFAIAITHDVDSAAGLERSRALAAMEAARGRRACYFVVGLDYPLDPAAMADLHAAGAEIGLHGPHHNNRIAFQDPEVSVSELDACVEAISEHQMRGFRSPSMLRTQRLYGLLADRFVYDSSMPDTGLLPARNGCATVFPLERQPSVLPLTLAPDGQLLGSGLSPDAVLAAWIAKAEWIADLGGVAVHLTHPEVGFSADAPMRAAHERFLDWVAEREDAWCATPVEIVEHWRARTA
jgi:peptidoglycan/xylan/chitin deacetylase (PgdA/CDA1 family)